LGSPGTILTFFYWPGLGQRGRPGQGQVLAFSFSVPLGSLDAWRRHLEGSGFPVEGRRQVFGEEALTLRDPDGFLIELIETKDSRAPGAGSGFVPESLAIRGFHTAPLGVASAAASTRHLVEDLGFRLVRNEAGRSRFEAGAGGPGTFADIVVVPQKGMPGLGTIHHVAWRVPDDATEAAFVRQLGTAGYSAGPVRDRSYFRSIYWREPSGILYEIATDVPGFAHDEPEATLGEALKLPAQFERFRAEIEASLPPVSAPKPE
jgi:glyoxalase family protein